MEDDYQQLKFLQSRIELMQQEYAYEIAELTKKRGFDSYSEKWQGKMERIASKYADLILPLKEEHDELADKINKAEEEKRKSQYVDPE